jgi:hypothetical protein
MSEIDPPKGKKTASSYDDKFLDSLANTNAYKQWSSQKGKLRTATSNAFDTERHSVNINSSNQDEVTPGTNPLLDQFANLNAEDPYEDIRAENQSGWEQLGKLPTRAVAKAAAEVAKIPGVIAGAIAAPFAEDGEGFDTIFNNEWVKSVDKLNKNVNEDLLPVYASKAMKEGNLWDNISSTAFWATDGADGLGFLVGMMAPGMAFEKLGLGSKLVESAANSKKLGWLTNMAGKAEEGTQVAKLMGMTGRNIDTALSVTGNTLLEAGAEAKGVGDDLDAKKPQFVETYNKKRMTELDQQRRSGQISIDQYNELSQNIGEEAEKAFSAQRALAMRDTFVSNVAILLGPNAIMHKAIWGKAAEKFEKTAEVGIKGIAKRAGKAALRWGEAGVSEGLWEEGSQTTVENMFVNKAMRGELGKKDANSFDLIGEFTKEYANTLSTVEGQKAIFLGGVLGGPMMSYQGRKEDVKNRKRTNAILDNIDSEILNFNTTFENNIYKKKEDGSFEYKLDENGEETTERILDNKEVRRVAKNLNFTERQSALFDLAVQSGNTEVVDQIKRQAIFNLIMPAIHNGEAGLKALEQKLNQDAQFNEIVERDAKSDSKDNSKNFVKETLESAKWLQSQKERFQDFSRDVIRLDNRDGTEAHKEQFFERLSASYLNSKYALRNAENDLKKLEDKRRKAYDEAGVDELYDPTSEFPTSKMKPGLVTDEKLEERATKTKEALESNELIKNIDKDYQAKKLEVEKHKKDIADIWKGGDNIQEAFNKFIGHEKAEENASSPEAVAKAQEFIDNVDSAQSKDELNMLMLPAHVSNEDYDRATEEHVVSQVSKSISNDDSTSNLKSNLDKLKALNMTSSAINDLIDDIEDTLSGRIEEQEAFKDTLEDVLDEYYSHAEEVQETLSKHQDELNNLISIQKALIKALQEENKSPRGRNAKILKQLIREAENQLEEVNKDISRYEKAINDLEGELKQLNKEINYIFDRYNQVNNLELETIQDIVDYLNKSSDLFKDHRQDLGVLLTHQLGTERRVEELEEAVDSLDGYRTVLKGILETYADMLGKIKPGTNMEDYKYVRDEFLRTSKNLQEAKSDLKDTKDKLNRINKAVINKQALNSLNNEREFWEDIQNLKDRKVNPLVKNPVIAQKIKEKEDQLNEEEAVEKEVEKNIQTELEETQKIDEPEEVVEIVVPPVTEDEEGDYQSESLPTREDEVEDEEVETGANKTEKEIDDDLDSPQAGAKVISTKRKTGKALYPNLESFVEYERTPRDKSGDGVTFSFVSSIADPNNVGKVIKTTTKEVEAAFNNLVSGIATASDIKLLEDELPIRVTFTYKKDGKEKKVHSFIENKTEDNQAHPDSQEILEKQTMPLRRNIIAQAVLNKGFDGISSNVIDQFPGVLKITQREEDGPVPMNSVLDLQVFDGMTKAQKIEYFQKNTGYVNWEGNLVSTLDKDHIMQTNIGIKSKGEVFLMVNQNNGTPFPLKLNVSRINEEKAEAVYEIVKSLSQVSQSIGKKTSFQALTVGQFFKQLDEIDPDLSASLQEALKGEIGFVKRTAKGDERNESLSRLLDLIIYHKSLNPKTGFNLMPDGNLILGSLAMHLLDGSGFEHKLSITKEELASPEAREAIMRYVQYKRHNILITRDAPGQFVFNNPAYVEYLLNKNMPLLTTNAVVNQPTFQGYSNIYLNQDVKNSKPVAKKVKEEVKKEITVESNEEGKVARTSQLFQDMLNAKKKKEEAPNSKQDVKTNVNELEILFNKVDDDTKAEVIFSLADKFNVLDKYTSDESFSSENLNKTFNELIDVAKKNNKSIDDIKQICGF